MSDRVFAPAVSFREPVRLQDLLNWSLRRIETQVYRHRSQALVALEDVAERRGRRTGTLLNRTDIGRFALACLTFLGCWVVRSVREQLGSAPSQRAQDVGIQESS